METALFGGPPEMGNMMKLANGQIGFMGMFAHPLFASVTDVIPAMNFAATGIINNKGVWITRIEQEKRKHRLINEGGFNDGAVSPRSQSPAPRKPGKLNTAQSPSPGYFPASPLQNASNPPSPLQQHVRDSRDSSITSMSAVMTTDDSPKNLPEALTWKSPIMENGTASKSTVTSTPQEVTPTSTGMLPSTKPRLGAQRPEVQARRSGNTVPRSLQINGVSEPHDESTTTTTASSEHGGDEDGRKSELRKSNYTSASVPLVYDDSLPDLPTQPEFPEQEGSNIERSTNQEYNVPVSKHYPVPNRPFSQAHNQAGNSGCMSAPSTTDGNSMATSGDQTYSTNPSTTLSPPTEMTSFPTVESSDEQVEDRGNGSWHPIETRGPDYDSAKSSPSTSPEVVPPNMMDHGPPSVHNGGSRTKSPVKTSETVRTWEEGDGERSMRRRISRLRFWKKRMDEDER